jgi:hypothetical protein
MAFKNVKAQRLNRKEIDHEKHNIEVSGNIVFAGCPLVGG